MLRRESVSTRQVMLYAKATESRVDGGEQDESGSTERTLETISMA